MRHAWLSLCLVACGSSPDTPNDVDASTVIDAATDDGPAGDAATDATDPCAAPMSGPGWHSALFAPCWKPLDDGGAADSEGRFLHDFSYAGYHRGESAPPVGTGTIAATVSATLGTGTTDATSAIQAAIDTACAPHTGLAVAVIPAGTYRIKLPTADAQTALSINCSNVALRGAGAATTHLLFDDAARARTKSALRIGTSNQVTRPSGTPALALAADVSLPTRTLLLVDASTLVVGDTLAITQPVSAAFRAAHRMDLASVQVYAPTDTVEYWPSSGDAGALYVRTVVAVSGNTVTIDAPTRDALATTDTVLFERPFLREVGIEALSIGMIASTATASPEPAGDGDYDTATGTVGYQVHASSALTISNVFDGWVDHVESYHPTTNPNGIEVLSHGITIARSAERVTLRGLRMGPTQYRGDGGNGYLYQTLGNDNLVVDSTAERGRHDFTFNDAASGNVLLRVTSTNARYADDSHRFLSHANLFDNITLDRAWLQAVNRGSTSTGAGFTATQTAYWNIHLVALNSLAHHCIVETSQFGWGYVIGTRSDDSTAVVCPTTVTNSQWAALDPGAPTDFVEGEGMAATLEPPSLYEAQRARRCAQITCD